MSFRVGEIGKGLRDAANAHGGRHHRGRVDLAFGDQPERRCEFVRRITQHILNVQFLHDAKHRLGAVGLHADADHDDARVAGRDLEQLPDDAGHADAFKFAFATA